MTTLQQTIEASQGQGAGEIEIGSFAPSAESLTKLSTVVVASYNIRYAVGSHLISGGLARRIGLTRPLRRHALVARNLLKAARALSDNRRLPSPQILALQEADRETIRAGGRHVARELARHLQMNYAFAPANVPEGEQAVPREWYLDFEEECSPTERGRTGVGLLSRLPFSQVERLDLPFKKCAWRPKLAIEASFQVGEKSFHIFNSHIDPHADIPEQIAQHSEVLAHADKLEGPVILLGDFNTLSRRSGVAMRDFLESEGFETPFPTGTATWRSGPIRLHTDWIFTRGARVVRFGVARPLSVSDHWPVWAEIDLSGEAGR